MRNKKWYPILYQSPNLTNSLLSPWPFEETRTTSPPSYCRTKSAWRGTKIIRWGDNYVWQHFVPFSLNWNELKRCTWCSIVHLTVLNTKTCLFSTVPDNRGFLECWEHTMTLNLGNWILHSWHSYAPFMTFWHSTQQFNTWERSLCYVTVQCLFPSFQAMIHWKVMACFKEKKLAKGLSLHLPSTPLWYCIVWYCVNHIVQHHDYLCASTVVWLLSSND